MHYNAEDTDLPIGDIIGAFAKSLDFSSRHGAFGPPHSNILTALFKLSEMTFSEAVLRLIDKRRLKPSEV